MQTLEALLAEPLNQSSLDVPLNALESQAAAIFDVMVLSHVSKSSKPIIGVWHSWKGSGVGWRWGGLNSLVRWPDCCINYFSTTVNVEIFVVTIFRGLNFQRDNYCESEYPTVIAVANSSCVQIFVGLIFHES